MEQIATDIFGKVSEWKKITLDDRLLKYKVCSLVFGFIVLTTRMKNVMFTICWLVLEFSCKELLVSLVKKICQAKNKEILGIHNRMKYCKMEIMMIFECSKEG